ncbi:RcnB family protein [Mesorhizobium sp. BR1-1-16]|uniref:RcnB family protein n=1 Tax=Mesorhizobium sp. BR1-1-16 TaxID=2876653 RepID=UPI001CC9BC9B|nr:RcnB family protein [Mesorhizobium sp. BR1-1-16]MBZ9937423.1 RcnB family protein [Mesorhizobium sp. BR1-1-16]
MKRILLASIAVAALAIPAANAQQSYRAPSQNHYSSHGKDQVHDGRGSHGKQQAWRKGQRIPQSQWGRDVDYRHHHLKAPPRGYRWVQQGNQYLMVGIASGIIASILNGH